MQSTFGTKKNAEDWNNNNKSKMNQTWDHKINSAGLFQIT